MTFKEGLLAAVGHDLHLCVERLSVDIDGARAVRARLDPRSIRVVWAVRDGEPEPGVLDEKDRAKIERTIRDEVLHTSRYDAIRFTSSSVVRRDGGGYRVEGELELHGARRTIAFDVREQGGRLVAELRIHQPDFGIRPFSAMLGALKVKPDVVVRVSVPAQAAVPQ